MMTSIEFLEWLRPGGPWVLTAINPSRKGIATKTVGPGDAEQFIAEYSGRWNLYFQVNPSRARATVDKKAEKADIAAMEFLHLDIDPRAGEDLEEERKRALARLTERLPRGVPAPSAVVFSGGGYQAFWRLSAPMAVDGDTARAEEAERYNRQLELLFGADHCHNLDRIMRLPGTLNIPDEKKRKKGRGDKMSEVVGHIGAAYDLSAFTPAPALQTSDAGFTGQTVRVSGNVQRVNDVAELDEWNVPDRIKVIIVQGHHPDEPKDGDNSRSAWVFDAVCGLVRCEVPDDVIFSIITDPDFGISESVIERGDKYAIRQIERAKEEAIDPVLREFNEEYAVARDGGKVRVIFSEVDVDNGRNVLRRMSFEDFRNFHMNRLVQDGMNRNGPVWKPAGKWWLDHPKRRQFKSVVFAPGREVPGAYNLWKGFAVPAIPGDWSLMEHHVRNVLAAGDPVSAEYILNWCAWAVQRPDAQAEVAVVFKGGRGTGKGIFANAMKELFGQHGLQVSSSDHLTGRFNSHLRDCCLLFADEAIENGDKEREGRLKTLITEDSLTIEGKGVDVVTASNFLHIMMASNEHWVIPAGHDERRFAVFEVSPHQQKQYAYFEKIVAQMRGGGLSAMLYDLLNRPLDGWHPRKDVPDTAALREQKARSAANWMHVIREMAEAGKTPDHDGWKPEAGWVSTGAILEEAGMNPKDRSAQMSVMAALRPLLSGEERKVQRLCIFERGSEIIVKGRHVRWDVRPRDRNMYRLKPLADVRALLGVTGVPGSWVMSGDDVVDLQEEAPF